MSYDLRDLEGEVRRLADAIGSMVRQIQSERREHALDVAAGRVVSERIAAALDKLVEIADSGGTRGGGGGIMDIALGSSLARVFTDIMKPRTKKNPDGQGCGDPDCPDCATPKPDDAPAVAADEEPINGKGAELAK